MTSPPTHPTLLHEIYDIGEHLLTALAGEDLEAVFTLMPERGALIERLNAYSHPADITPEWESIATRLAAQHRTLSRALSEQEHRLSHTLGNIGRYKDARHSYGAPAPSGGLLSHNLKG